jgi:hypothetical protein
MAADIAIHINRACTAAHKRCAHNPRLEESRMADSADAQVYRRMFRLYPAQDGWIYEVWIASRPVVVGWCHTQEAALQEAALA